MPHASEFITDLAASGRHHFKTEEAVRVLGASLPAVRASLRRLSAKHAHVVAPLVRARSTAGAERVDRWKLAVNATVEPDA